MAATQHSRRKLLHGVGGQALLSSRTYPRRYKHNPQLFSPPKESRSAKSNQSSCSFSPHQLPPSLFGRVSSVSSPHSRKRGRKSVLCILLRRLSWLIIYNSQCCLEALNAWSLILLNTAERYTERAQNCAPRSLPTKSKKKKKTTNLNN